MINVMRWWASSWLPYRFNWWDQCELVSAYFGFILVKCDKWRLVSQGHSGADSVWMMCVCRECTNLEIRVDIETKPNHLCLTSEEDLTPHSGYAAAATIPGGEEPQDCSSRRGGTLFGSVLGLSPGVLIREGLRDVTLAQPESIRSDLEMSDTQSDDIAELTSDDCDSPYPKSCHLAAGQQPQPPSCRALNTPEGLHCPADSNVVLYVWENSQDHTKKCVPLTADWALLRQSFVFSFSCLLLVWVTVAIY